MSQSPSRQLLVEGPDDFHLACGIFKRRGLPEAFDVVERNGFPDLLRYAEVSLRNNTALTHLGMIVDADSDHAKRWREVRKRLLSVGVLDLPENAPNTGAIATTATGVRVGVWMLPDNLSPGVLEHFFRSLIPHDDVLLAHAQASIDAIPNGHTLFKPQHRIKAEVQTWLAWREDPGTPMGAAIGKGYVNPEHPGVDALLAWLRALFEIEPAPVPA
ncbi:DUF3226 domain-containing protein [Azospirillum sp.]|uniref:DUF3226 domain-containing protein n=1 Tax=Azospirillum sp. TaxID=34012 RepID=UPI002D6B6192|nr:DUF3226 domain-containing protein [Azospirillum sp.]HYD65293.1 DUF3226 domain-containing protein [Azospirillum sp.]